MQVQITSNVFGWKAADMHNVFPDFPLISYSKFNYITLIQFSSCPRTDCELFRTWRVTIGPCSCLCGQFFAFYTKGHF